MAKQPYLSYVKDPANLLSEMYFRMKQRTERNNLHKMQFTKNRFMEWAYSKKFRNMYSSWEYSDFNWHRRPTVDRINSTRGYELRNMQLLTWEENREKATWDIIDKPRKDNSSGRTGVNCNITMKREHPTWKYWTATVVVNKKSKSKNFFTRQEAVDQRELWEKEYYA